MSWEIFENAEMFEALAGLPHAFALFECLSCMLFIHFIYQLSFALIEAKQFNCLLEYLLPISDSMPSFLLLLCSFGKGILGLPLPPTQ